MPLLDNNGVKIHYELVLSTSTADNIETVLLIHGAGLDMNSWEFIVPYLQEHYHVLRYDFRGHGSSDKSDDKLTWELLYQDALFLISSFGVKQYLVAGHGAGSIIAILLGVLNPNIIKSIILMSLPFFFPRNTATKFTIHRKELAQGGSILPLAEHVIKNITLFKPDSLEVQKLYDAFSKVTLETYFDLWDSLLKIHDELFNYFKRNTKPILIISGEHDPIYPPYLSGLQTAFIPHSRCMTILNSSNMVFYDQPKETFYYIHRFFQNNNSLFNHTDPFLKELHTELFETLEEQQNSKKTVDKLKVDLINEFQVFINGKKIVSGWNQRYAKQLFIYLVLNHSVTRDQICDDLWGDIPIAKARHNLRVYLSHLRSLLNDKFDFIAFDKEHIFLNGDVECDLLIFMQNVYQALNETDSNCKKTLCNHLLAKLTHNSFRNLLDEWILGLRLKLENQLLDLFNCMSEYHLEQEEYLQAIQYLQASFQFESENESICDLISDLYMKCNRLDEAKLWKDKKGNIRTSHL